VWLVWAVGQPDQVIELRSPSDQTLCNFRGLVPDEEPVDGGPNITYRNTVSQSE
jgi:hypothetical protein